MAAKAFVSAVGQYGHAKALETVVIAAGHLTKEIVTFGTGSERPPRGANVKAHYVGKLTNGTDFDSSRKRGRAFAFDIGAGRVIKGWVRGICVCHPFSSSLQRQYYASLLHQRSLDNPALCYVKDVGIATMLKGEKAVFTISPEYGYGAAGAGGVIPPNATLLFEVELLEVRTSHWHCLHSIRLQSLSLCAQNCPHPTLYTAVDVRKQPDQLAG